METIKDRLIKFLAYLKIGQGKFEKNCGLSNGTVNNIKDGGVTTQKIERIMLTYPNLSIEWLITGKGEMLKSSNPLSNSATVHGDVSGSVVGNGVLHNGNVNGDGNIVGIVPADVERQLVRAKAEIDVLKKRIKEIETHHKKEKEVLNKMLDQAILDKERAMSMLEKALNK